MATNEDKAMTERDEARRAQQKPGKSIDPSWQIAGSSPAQAGDVVCQQGDSTSKPRQQPQQMEGSGTGEPEWPGFSQPGLRELGLGAESGTSSQSQGTSPQAPGSGFPVNE